MALSAGFAAPMAHGNHPGESGHHEHPLAADAVSTYFECITACSIDDGECVTRCVEVLREEG
jgi:hypothetical protein